MYDTHLHISLSDDEGLCVGGHVLNGCVVFTTAEVTLLNIRGLDYSRQVDPHTGYKELVVSEAPSLPPQEESPLSARRAGAVGDCPDL